MSVLLKHQSVQHTAKQHLSMKLVNNHCLFSFHKKYLFIGKVKTTADKFLPTIVVEFMCTDPSFNKYKVENSVVDLVKKNIIPTNCTQDVR